MSVVDLIQDAYDTGLRNKSKIAELVGVSRRSVARAVQAGRIEYYIPFDEDWIINEVDLIVCEDDLRELLGVIISESIRRCDLCIDEYSSDKSFGAFIRKIYGNIKTAVTKEGGTPYLSCIHITCPKCNGMRQLTRYKIKINTSLGISNVCSDCLYTSYVNHPNRKMWSHQRRALKCNLPSQKYKTQEICVLSDSKKTAHDHFIPLGIGHGGTFSGNMISLDRTLNSSKLDNNPFMWFEANRQRFKLDQSRFDSVVADLAEQNGLTSEEYRRYVDWCFENKRSLDDIQADNKRFGYVVTSVELWREAVGLQFPLRFDNREQTYVVDKAA